jgi:hypothetical protein|tara:strand:+ start:22 stop:426 length:405 start_codon:yes stop_codon:yes gene_type:complete
VDNSANRVYHHYTKWEDHKYGFYDNCSGELKGEKIKAVVRMFNSKNLTVKYMNRVIDEWKYSCEHNLTNPSMNKIAYIGQGACCLYAQVPNTVTMEAWNLLDKNTQDRSDAIAKKVIDKWTKENEGIQLCLNIE